MKTFTLEWHDSRFYCKGELVVTKNGVEIDRIKINQFYSLESDWFYIYDSVGGSGTGYKPGEIIRKIDMRFCEYKKVNIS